MFICDNGGTDERQRVVPRWYTKYTASSQISIMGGSASGPKVKLEDTRTISRRYVSRKRFPLVAQL